MLDELMKSLLAPSFCYVITRLLTSVLCPMGIVHLDTLPFPWLKPEVPVQILRSSRVPMFSFFMVEVSGG
jgi:hypothetical protein